jgi:hypothetical protein
VEEETDDMNDGLRRVKTWGVSLTVAALCGFGNPALIACSSASEEEDEWGYTAEDMEAVVVGEYAGQVDGQLVSIRISRPKAAPSSAASPELDGLSARTLQCGSRSFVRPAGACISQTSLTIDADITSAASVIASGKVEGRYVVFGRGSAVTGRLDFNGSAESYLMADVRDGVVMRWYLQTSTGQVDLPLTPVQ